MAVGMPFKDIATVDTLLMQELPAANDAAGRRALRRLQDVGMHVIAPAAAVTAAPLPDAIPLVDLADAMAGSANLPEGLKRCDGLRPLQLASRDAGLLVTRSCGVAAGRSTASTVRWKVADMAAPWQRHPAPRTHRCRRAAFLSPLPSACSGHRLRDARRMALRIDGTEADEALRAIGGLDPIVVLLDVAPGVSRIHASRRVFDRLKSSGIDTPVVHHRRFPAGVDRDEIVITTGSEVGGLLVDGLGDGVLLEVPGEDTEFLRTTSFGLLQVCDLASASPHFVTSKPESL
jgi:hypothetical protein